MRSLSDIRYVLILLLVSSSALAADTDSDGMDDAWEQFYFGNLLQGAADNPDGDAYTNLQEHDYGNDPTIYFNPVFKGFLDTGFGVNGKAINDLPQNNYGEAVIVQPDGKYLISGSIDDGSGQDDILVARYLADGSIDNSFGNNGIYTLDIISGKRQSARDIAIQSDGKILVAASSSQSSFYGEYMYLLRLNIDGTLDASFATDGVASYQVDSSYWHTEEIIKVLEDDSILLIGEALDPNTFKTFAQIIKYDSTGSLDTNFGTSGVVSLDLGGDDGISVALIQADGKIVMTGESLIIRLNNDGSLDNSFGSSGIIELSLPGVGNLYVNGDIAQLPDGKLQLAAHDYFPVYDVVLIRLNTDGSLDTGFDGDGYVIHDLGGIDIPRFMQVLPDGSIFLKAMSGETNYENIAFARFMPDGAIDTSFGVGGVIQKPASVSGSDSTIFLSNGDVIDLGVTNSDISLSRFLAGLTGTDNDNDGIEDSVDVDDDNDGYYDDSIIIYQEDFEGVLGAEWILTNWSIETGVDARTGDYYAFGEANYTCGQFNYDCPSIMTLTYNIPAPAKLSFWVKSDSASPIGLHTDVDDVPAILAFADNSGYTEYSFDHYSVGQHSILWNTGCCTGEYQYQGPFWGPFYLDDVVVVTIADAFPLDPNESLDTDSDGIGNNADWDDDGDGVPDVVDVEPLNNANSNEVNLPLDSTYKGTRVESQQVKQ